MNGVAGGPDRGSFVVDAHQHVWDPRRATYDWLGAEHGPINRSIGMDELRPHLKRNFVDATILVQSADNDEDTDLMISVAGDSPEVVGIVAYVALEQPGRAAERVAQLQANALIVGVRNLIHDRADADWLLRDDVAEGLRILEDAGLPFDLVAVLPRHLELVPLLSERHPRLKMVIDHLAKPPIGREDREPWWSLIAEAAKNPLVFAKVSGLYSAAGESGAWTVDAIRPHWQRAVEVFGTGRLMYGGDWPISVLAGGYDRVWEGLSMLFAELSSAERHDVLSDTAMRFYNPDASRVQGAIEHARSAI